MNTNLLVGAIGCGYWGPNLVRNCIELPDVDLVAISDLDQERLDHMHKRFPQIEVVTRDYWDLFSLELDAVIIATPPHTHAAIAKDCLRHGLNILVEKPLTLSSQDAKELITLADEVDKVLMVGHTFEYNSSVRALKDMIDRGEIGNVHYIDMVRASLGLFQTRANVLWDLAPHDISILRYLLDSEPIKVGAHGAAHMQLGVEDVVYATMTFPNQVLAHLRMSWLDPSKTRRITVVGSEKMIIYDDVAPLEKIKIYDKRVKAIRHTDTFGEFSFAYHYGDVVSPYIHNEEPLRVQINHFLDCIREGKTPLSDGYSGLKVVQALEAAQRSLDNNGEVVAVDNGKMVDFFSGPRQNVVSIATD
jgi:predicted dehydrogenase